MELGLHNLNLVISNDDWKWEKLEKCLPKVSNKEKIKLAWEFGYHAHLGQKRDSGEMYFTHPVWIASVVAQLNIGDEAVCAALLHDTVEDTEISLEMIANMFGDEVALLVSGLTDIKDRSQKAVLKDSNIEIYKKFLFSSVNDVRVLVIRLVDKLHNGLTLKHVSQEKKAKYGKKVLAVYAPVAEYVGLHYFKRLLEDLAFEAVYPIEARQINSMLVGRRKEEERVQAKLKYSIEQTLRANHVTHYEIQSRIKGLYSTFQKIKKKGDSYNFKDRIGLRILVDSIEVCYTILGLLHAQNKHLPDEFDDYISNPKINGYRSLQTTLVWGEFNVEVQIRTFEMHDFNEFGPASHIAYKLNSKNQDSMGYEWVKNLVAWEKDKDKNVKNYKISVLQDHIYVFTPHDDVIQLPKSSVALDFAYYIHREIGEKCIGAKINETMGKLSTPLKTGDKVEIIVGSKINVNRDWLRIAKTKHALEQIRKNLVHAI